MAATLYSNMGLQLTLAKEGGKVLTTKAGDRHVLEAMLKEGLSLGGEQSGHIIFLDYSTTGDGILTSLQLLTVMKKSGQRLSELAGQMGLVPQRLVNVRVRSKLWEDNAAIKAVVADAHQVLGESGRLLVRASGTEPLIRVMAEGTDATQVEAVSQRVATVIARELG